jgi:hypothetical protein
MTRRKYATVNGRWPDTIPPLTGPEAVTAAKRLWRTATGSACPYRVVVTTGARVGRWIVRGGFGTRLVRDDKARALVLIVNPKAGWHEFVHSLSHKAHRKLHPGIPDHDDLGRHAFVERSMIDHVVGSGWLDGRLKRPERPAPSREDFAKNVRAERAKRIDAAIIRWERKAKRAERALRKLRRQRHAISRAISASGNCAVIAIG